MTALRWWLLRHRLRRIRLLVLDVDGVLTDGGLWFDADGRLSKRFDVRDGLGIRLLQQTGLEIALLSGGQGGATEVRARQLGIQHCLVGIKDKPVALSQLQNKVGVQPDETAFVGDDLNAAGGKEGGMERSATRSKGKMGSITVQRYTLR